MTEVTFIDQLRAGHPGAYDRLYHSYWKLLYKKAYSRVLDEAAAKDIIQEVFISIWQRRRDLAINTSLEQFLLGAVRLQVLNHFRSEQVKRRALDQAMLHMQAVQEDGSLAVSRAAMEVALDEALQDIPENMKQTFLLRCDNLSIRDIANRLGLAEQTVSNHIGEVVKRMKRKLAQREQPDEFLLSIALFLALVYQ